MHPETRFGENEVATLAAGLEVRTLVKEWAEGWVLRRAAVALTAGRGPFGGVLRFSPLDATAVRVLAWRAWREWPPAVRPRTTRPSRGR